MRFGLGPVLTPTDGLPEVNFACRPHCACLVHENCSPASVEEIREEESSSGTNVEPASELDQALEEICALEESFPVEATDSKQAKAEEDKHKAEEIRQKAMESYGQTKTRLTSDETQAEPKKKRRGGNDSRDSFEKNLNKS